MGDPVVQWQMVVREPDVVARFYRELFGWRVRTDNALGYRAVETGGRARGGIDGGIWPAPPGASEFVQLFVEVDDVDAAVTRATGLGARVVVPKSVLPDGDTMAVLADPSGLAFGLVARRGQREQSAE